MLFRSSMRVMYAPQSICAAVFVLQGESMRRYFVRSLVSEMEMNAKATASMFGYVVIELPGLVLPPEGDLIIDTELMTVTLNGQDVTRYFGADSEFFRLRPGENIIIHEDGTQKRNVSYKILWKDMWL